MTMALTSMEIQVTNLGAATSTYLWLHDVNMPFTLTPSFVVPLTLATGATSAYLHQCIVSYRQPTACRTVFPGVTL